MTYVGKTQRWLKTSNTPVLLCSIGVFLTLTRLLFLFYGPFLAKSKALLLISILLTCTYFFPVSSADCKKHLGVFLTASCLANYSRHLTAHRSRWVDVHEGGLFFLTKKKKKLCDLIYGCTDRNAVNKKLFAARTQRAGGFLFLRCCCCPKNLK